MIKDKKTKQIRVRMAPSPTGPFHIGTARTALFNWLYARHNGGAFVLRIEDTDVSRSDPKFERDILDGLTWLGIDWDEGPTLFSRSEKGEIPNSKFQIPNKKQKGVHGPYRQSERLPIYEKYLKKLLDEQKAYYCYCTKEELDKERRALLADGLPPKYMGRCRSYTSPPAGKSPELIRFKVPEKIIEFTDMIRGKISFDTGLFGDIAIAKNLRGPFYNFAVVVDDATMEITHVIRGEDHIPNTPKQLLIQEALGFGTPIYAHLPLILSPDRSKLSKRYAETSLLAYRNQGYLPQAVVNFMAFLGWHPKEEKEMMTLEELVKVFDIARVQKAGAIFNEEKLTWLNAQYLKNLRDEELAELIMPGLSEKGISVSTLKLQKIIHLEKARMKTLNDFLGLTDFFFELPDYDAKLLIWKSVSKEKIRENLSSANDIITALNEDTFNAHNLEEALLVLTKELGNGEVLWPLRAVLSGKRASPGPFEIAEILGKTETLRRLEIALKKLI